MTQEYDDLLFGVRRSVRYHSRRRNFFSNCHRLAMLLVLLGGTASIAVTAGALLDGYPLLVQLIPALAITAISLCDLVLGFSDRAWRHGDMERRFIDLEKALETVRANPTSEDIARLTRERLDIEKDEPPVLRVLDTLCHNELLRAMGYPRSEQIKVGFWQRRLAHIMDLREHTLYTDAQ